jgi:hypothetical protein
MSKKTAVLAAASVVGLGVAARRMLRRPPYSFKAASD